jgi:hypothetical protein
VFKRWVGVIPACFQFGKWQCIGPVAVNLVRRHVNKGRLRARTPRRLQQLKRSQCIHLEIEKWNRCGAIMRRLSRCVNDKLRLQLLHQSQDRFTIADIDRHMAIA